MSIVVRDVAEADLEAVARVHVQAWRESYADFLSAEALQGLSVEERLAMWRRALAASDRGKFLVAEERGEIVGFARGGPVRLNEGGALLNASGELYAIYLLERAKRRGIGRRLALGVFDHLAEEGFESCGLWVLSGNRGARRFYESLGGVAGPSSPSPCAARPSRKSPTASSRSLAPSGLRQEAIASSNAQLRTR